jgi:hypothetical protein
MTAAEVNTVACEADHQVNRGKRPATTLRATEVRKLLEALVSDQPRAGRRRRLMPMMGGATVLLPAACASVVTGDHASAPVTNTSWARCYTSASLAPAGAYKFIGTTVTLTNVSGASARVTDALGVCAVLWRQGLLIRGKAGLGPRIGRDHRVPPLVACVMPDGIAAVFPGHARTCAALGLPRSDGTRSPRHNRPS